MVRLRRLKINTFRGLAPTELVFADGLNVLLGQNGGGKTTLLELISAVVSSSLGRFRREAIDVEAEFVEDGERFRLCVAWTPRMTEAGVRRIVQEHEWCYSIEHEGPGHTTRIERSSADGGVPGPTEVGFTFMATADDDVAPFPFQPDSHRFDEALEYFGRITAEDASAIVALTEELSQVWTHASHELVPEDVVTQLMHKRAEVEAPFGARLCAQLGASSAMLRPRVEAETEEARTIRGFDLRVRFGDTEVDSSQLSFGQKRLFAFFWYCACNEGGVVIADELVSGLHYSWVQACLDEIGPRQAFLAIQNPLLLEHLQFESADDVKRTFVLCSVETVDARRQWVWAKPTDHQAELFLQSFQAGIRHVSEILRTQGLW